MSQVTTGKNGNREVEIPARDVTLSGELNIPRNAAGVVLFAPGSGSSRHSPRNRYVAQTIRNALDYPVIEMNRQAYSRLRCEKEIEIVPGATHLFAEPGTIDQVAHLAAEWFQTHLPSSRRNAKDEEMADEYVAVTR